MQGSVHSTLVLIFGYSNKQFYVWDKCGVVFAKYKSCYFRTFYPLLNDTMFGDFERGMSYAYNLGWDVS